MDLHIIFLCCLEFSHFRAPQASLWPRSIYSMIPLISKQYPEFRPVPRLRAPLRRPQFRVRLSRVSASLSRSRSFASAGQAIVLLCLFIRINFFLAALKALRTASLTSAPFGHAHSDFSIPVSDHQSRPKTKTASAFHHARNARQIQKFLVIFRSLFS